MKAGSRHRHLVTTDTTDTTDEAAKSTADNNILTHLRLDRDMGMLERTGMDTLAEAAQVETLDIALPAHTTTWGIRTINRACGKMKSEPRNCGDTALGDVIP